MTHHIEIDRRRSSAKNSQRRIEKSRSGRIKAEYMRFTERTRRRLATRLRGVVDGEVRFDRGARALYATDASNYRQVPLGVVVPRSVDGVVSTIEACREYDTPIVSRGGGTSLAGEACNVAVVIDWSKYLDHLISIDPNRQHAKVEPGCVLDTLRDAAEEHHLTFGPDPATHDRNTLGGMIGNNSCGVHSVMAGRTSDNVETLDILTYDGLRTTVGETSPEVFDAIVAKGGRLAEIYTSLVDFRDRYGDLIRQRFPDIPRRVSGYENLDQLLPENNFNVARALVGTEGTCVTVLGATLNLVESPSSRVLAILGFPDIFKAADAVPEVLEYGPIGLEGIDDLLIDFVRRKQVHPEDIRMLPEGAGWLVAEFGGSSRDEASAKARKLVGEFHERGCSGEVVDDPAQQNMIWELRESALAATAHIPGEAETWPGWEDSAVRREDLGRYLRDFKELLHRHGYKASVYGHFGDGLVHTRIPFDLRTESGLENWQAFLDEAADLVVKYGGSLSGEHGDGQARAALIDKMYGPELVQAFREFKAIWDPAGKMNPGKVVDPFPITSNLRVGPSYQPGGVYHHYAYPEDGGDFARATRRCVGVGACRRTDSEKGVMCPSYLATHEEKHSTRGRARLLFEMLHGGAINDGWRSNEVEEALDLCLACKGCKQDCPVQVDMATYKSEFRAHHYRRRMRPRVAYSMGLIHRWSRLAGRFPGLANTLLGTRTLGGAVKMVAGIAPQRQMPRYAQQTFTDWFAKRPRGPTRDQRVVLWPDTFNNYFRPETAKAAIRLLEHVGYEVLVPERPLCCGRPLYDWGMLDTAKSLWKRNLDTLGREIEAGTPIIGLEPACVSAFRDELPNLCPGNERAERLSKQTLFLTEFLDQHVDRFDCSASGTAALVQFHCHHHAVLDTDAEKRVMSAAGIEHDILASGCCGMAGAFGFEVDKYDISQDLAERVLLPKVRDASDATAIVANGFSCREQIEQGSGRKAVHIAELLDSLMVPEGR